ncbi:MAG: hypothetical protein JO316_11820 [Abitibacteriaceae bacterium]|nr:hypothetical protein [Abditibacteriaceae bacterium]
MLAQNRYLSAIKENFNVVGMTAAVALSAATLNPLPFLAGLVVEAVYLVFVPDSKWYEARLSKRFDAEVNQRRERLKQQLLPTLRPVLQARFMRLEEVRQRIAAQSMDEQIWFREVLRKLDYLLEKFLQFASKEMQFRTYLEAALQQERNDHRGRGDDGPGLRSPNDTLKKRRSHARASTYGSNGFDDNIVNTAPHGGDHGVQETVQELQASYDENLNGIRRLVEQEQEPSTKAVLEKRLDVLQRRREFVGKMGKMLSNLDHQLELLEDTFGLISDEVCARSPEQVLADIEDVITQTNTMTELLEEYAPFEQSMAHMSSSI